MGGIWSSVEIQLFIGKQSILVNNPSVEDKRFNFCYSIKDRVHCFSTRVVMIKYYLLNPGKNFCADPCSCLREKRKNRSTLTHSILKKMTWLLKAAACCNNELAG